MKPTVQLLVVAFLFVFINLSAQTDKLLSVKHMQKDFDDMLLVIEAHPDPFTHISEDDFMARYKEAKSSITQPLSTLDFYKKISSIVALIKDGHSSTRFPNGWLSKQRKANGAFPFKVHLSNDDELYITKNYGATEVPVPSRIISLNGLSVPQFLEKIDPFISYELKRFRNTIIDDRFEMYLYLAFGYSDKLELEYLHTDTTSIVVQNIPLSEWRQDQKKDRQEKEKLIARGQPYDYQKLKDGVGMISIYSFSVSPDNLDNYERFLRKTFTQIAEDDIHSLIIDVRGNYGGWPKIASKLFHYITDQPFKTMAQTSMKVSKAYREYYLNAYPHLRYNTVQFSNLRHHINLNAVLQDELGTYVNESNLYNELPKTRKFEFTGDCYLLTNRDSYSAASSFASTFQCYQMGSIIGEETGGTKIFRANAMYEQLKRSAIWVRMSTTKDYCACFNDEFEGVTPTIEYLPSIFEIGSEMDTQLLYTQRLIKQVQKKKLEADNGE